MCAGAIINARLRRVIYGAADPKAGSFGSVIDFNSLPYNHKPELTAGVLQGECAGVLMPGQFQRPRHKLLIRCHKITAFEWKRWSIPPAE